MKQALLVLISLVFVATGCAPRPRPPMPVDVPLVCPDQPAVDTDRIGAGSPEFFDSGPDSELVTCLPTTWKNGYKFIPIYAVRLTHLKAGQVLHVDAEFEATNDAGVNVMIASQIGLSPDLSYDHMFEAVTAANGFNITPGMHHGTTVRTGDLIISANISSAYLVLWGWSATDALPASYLKIEQNYGGLSGYEVGRRSREEE